MASGNNMPTTGGGQVDARRRADLMREEVVHEELRQEQRRRDAPDEDAGDSLTHHTGRRSIYIFIEIIVAAVLIGFCLYVYFWLVPH
jgi:hypothetical protein